MTANEWLEVMKQAQGFPKGMEKLIVKYGEMLIEEHESKVKKLTIPDVMLSLPAINEIEAWAKEQAKIEPTGAEEFGRIWGAMWMRGLIEQKLKGNGA